MPKIDVVDTKGQKVGQLTLPDKIFAAKINRSLMAQAVRVFLANQRRAGAKVKDRGEVAGSGRKIWRQKGTGRARHGDRYAPIFVGGGVAHGPTGEQNYQLKLPAKMKRAALLSALSSKLKEKSVVVVEGLDKVKPKTKAMAKIMADLRLDNLKILLVLPAKQANLARASHNLKKVSLRQFNYLNTYRVLAAQKILLTKDTVAAMAKQWI